MIAPVRHHETTYNIRMMSYDGYRLNMTFIQNTLKPTVPIMVISAGSSEFPRPLIAPPAIS